MINTPITDPAVKRDYAEAQAIGRRHNVSSERAPAELRREKRADFGLFVELLLNVGVTFGLVYAVEPVWLKVLLLAPWSLYSALSADNIIHYLNHWPLSRREPVNVLVRALHVPLLLCPLEIRYVHWEHHKYNDIEVEPREWMRAIAGRSPRPGRSVLRYAAGEVWGSMRGALPWAELPPFLEKLRTTRPAHYQEIRATRWAGLLVLILLGVWDPRDTALFFFPAVFVAPLVASLLMNLTDHIPGTLTHPFRQATWLEPATWRERLFSKINRHSAATHLTHHLFPQVHWTRLPALQRELAPIYTAHGAPRSLLHTSVLLGNWAELFRLYLVIERNARRQLAELEGEAARLTESA